MVDRVYLDEDSCGIRLIAALRRHRLDVVAADEVGNRFIADSAQLEFAQEQGRPIVTGNYKDFGPLQTSWSEAGREHPGFIIWHHSRFSPESLAEQIFEILIERTPAQLRNALIWL